MSVPKSKCDECNISYIISTLNGRCPIDGALCKK